ncbi:MAG: bifunctional riboflavin kinase/FAD synthetase [Christensenellaceae bacterium]|jgi:riboflavin kinase/FMN adenylyltransferase
MELFKREIGKNKNNAVAIGTFDGLHIAHQVILAQLKSAAEALGGNAIVYTFYNVPAAFFAPTKKALFTKTEKVAAFQKTGIDYLDIHTFNATLAKTPREAFADYLVDTLGAATVVVGYDFHFGANAAGDARFLQAYLAKRRVAVEIIEEVDLDDIPISSTYIRKALRIGDVTAAARMLGRPYSMAGEVVTGRKVGRTLGFPTINMEIPEEKLAPEYGVYATEVIIAGKCYQGVTNIGLRPTVETRENVICETYLFDTEENFYGKTAEVFFLQQIRREEKFSSLQALQEQIEKDKRAAQIYFANKKSSGE